MLPFFKANLLNNRPKKFNYNLDEDVLEECLEEIIDNQDEDNKIHRRILKNI